MVKYEREQLTSLILVDVFAEVAEVNVEALNIKSYQPQQNIAEEVPKQNVFSYSYLSILFAVAKNPKIQGLDHRNLTKRHCLKSLNNIA